jgi:hypothetical protein
MTTLRFVKTVISCGVLFLASQTASATDSAELTCPTTEELQQFHVQGTMAWDFDFESQKLKFVVGAALESKNIDFSQGFWVLNSRSFTAAQSEDIQDAAKAIIAKLVPVSPTPFQYDIEVNDDGSIEKNPVCIYTLPDNHNVNAIVFHLPGYDTNGDDASVKKQAGIAQYKQRFTQTMKKLSSK